MDRDVISKDDEGQFDLFWDLKYYDKIIKRKIKLNKFSKKLK